MDFCCKSGAVCFSAFQKFPAKSWLIDSYFVLCTRRVVQLKTACCTFRSGEGRAGGVAGTKWELLVGFALQPRARAAQRRLEGQAGHTPRGWGSCSASLLWGSLLLGVHWSSGQGHHCILEVIEKERIFWTFIKRVSFPPEQPVLVPLALSVLYCIPAFNALRRAHLHCYFSCSGDTIL